MEIKADTKEFTRKLKLREHFADCDFEDESLVKHPSNLNIKCDEPELTRIIEKIELTDPIPINTSDNLTSSERKALKELNDMQDVVIKKADKGSTLVIMDTNFYRDKLIVEDHLHSNTYRQVDNKSDKHCFTKLKCLMDQHRACLKDSEYKYITNFEWRSSNFYGLPKIHKSESIISKVKSCSSTYLHMSTPKDLKVRPVVAGPNAPTQHLSALLEKILKPLVCHQKSYIKDDWDFIRKFPTNISYPCTLYSCDISSLYTSIDLDLGLTALNFWIDRLRELIPARFTKEFIIDSARFVLCHNFFMFDDVMWHQLVGTAMGTIFAPPYACLTMGFLEITKLYPKLRQLFTEEICKQIEDAYYRYMDDGITPLPKEVDISVFKEILNNLHPGISFTVEQAVEVLIDGLKVQQISYMDINVMVLPSGIVQTDVYYKPTNNHDYLDFNSHHPDHIKKNIPYNLAKRIVVFCSNFSTEEKRLLELKGWLLNCNYPLSVIEKGFRDARLQGPAPDPNLKKASLPLVTTYFSNFDSKNIAIKCERLLSESGNDRIKEVFGNQKTVLALRQPKNLLRHLTKSEFSSNTAMNTEKPPGLFCCNRSNCNLCKLYIQECSSFKTSNNYNWTIKCHINCHSKLVVYYLKCICCNLETYIGKTNNFRARMNNHISESRSGSTSNIFDRHVYNCRKKQKLDKEPFFHIYAFMTVSKEELLIPYESHLQERNFDTMNS